MLIIFLTLILVVGLVASFVSFTYPLSVGGVKYKYSSFVNELVLGSDLSSGVMFEYQAITRSEADEEKSQKEIYRYIKILVDFIKEFSFFAPEETP